MSDLRGDATHRASYRVTGMTCQHCVNSVSGEVGKVPNVTGVHVDLDSGTVSVTGSGPLDDAAIHAAIDEAGYDVVPSAVGA